MTILQNNKKALADYEISEKIEAGISLEGWEVKSISNHQVGLSNSFIREKDGELFLVGAHIPSWKLGVSKSKEEEYRDRKILVKRREIKHLSEIIERPGYAVVPLKFYRNNKNYIKLELGVGRGRKKFDKRQKLKEKDLNRRIELDRKKYNF